MKLVIDGWSWQGIDEALDEIRECLQNGIYEGMAQGISWSFSEAQDDEHDDPTQELEDYESGGVPAAWEQDYL